MGKAVDFFERVALSNRRQDILADQLDLCRAQLEVRGVACDKLPGAKNPTPGAIPDALASLYEVGNWLAEEIHFGQLLIDQAMQFLWEMEAVEDVDPLTVDMVRYRYMFGLSWSEVASKVCLSAERCRHRVADTLALWDDCLPMGIA